MMEWTDRHCRYFLRLISKHARLYTEMVTADAVLRGDRNRLLAFHPAEHPVALQVGGSDPKRLAEAARIGGEFGYNEINLNVGCPSDRVQAGRFGACLMAEPELVADLIAAMSVKSRAPVTVKCRIGIDDQDAEESLDRFIDTVARSGCRTFILHARKAWLEGLSPKENRDIPPVDYDRVYRIKVRRPDLTIVVNGGIGSFGEAVAHLAHVDGVMLGRAAYHDPYVLAQLEHALFDTPLPDRGAILAGMRPYIEAYLRGGDNLNHVGRHLLGLFLGLPGARAFRRHLSEHMHRAGADFGAIAGAMAAMPMQRQAA